MEGNIILFSSNFQIWHSIFNERFNIQYAMNMVLQLSYHFFIFAKVFKNL
jgi:hypothetical protein